MQAVIDTLKDYGVLPFCLGLLIGAMRPFWTFLSRFFIGPKIAVDLDDKGSLIDSPAKTVKPDTGNKITVNARFVRIKVANAKRRMVQNCRAHLVSVENVINGVRSETRYVDHLPLIWSYEPPDRLGIDIPRRLHRYVDVVASLDATWHTGLAIQSPLQPARYNALFEPEKAYRVTVCVTADGCKTKYRSFRVKWVNWKIQLWPDDAPEPPSDESATSVQL